MNVLNDPRQPSTSTQAEIIASERREQALTEAYAEGRKDEREEWAPVLAALRAIVDRDLSYFCGYVLDGLIPMDAIKQARHAIMEITK